MPRAMQADRLADRYHEGDAYFSTPTCTLLCHGRRAELVDVPAAALGRAASALLHRMGRAHGVPLLMGAVPFAPEAAARLFTPERHVFGTRGVTGHGHSPAHGRTLAVADVRATVPTAQEYMQRVSRALECIRSGTLKKVVLARSLRLALHTERTALLRALIGIEPLAHVFAVDVQAAGDEPCTLMGASPELVLSRRGRRILSRPLAGSAPRSPDPQEDRGRAEALLRSAKDLDEHAVVVESIARALQPHCNRLHVPRSPKLVATATMWHLGSEIEGELSDSAMGSLGLALLLHPTPAVCGQPSATAQAFIRAAEGFDRGFFAGLVGWTDASGDGDWALAIRCAEVRAESTTLYAGAGIVRGSDPAAELRETAAKLRTMLHAMGLELPRQAWDAGDSATAFPLAPLAAPGSRVASSVPALN